MLKTKTVKKLKNNKYKSNRNNKRLLFFMQNFCVLCFVRNVLYVIKVLKYKKISDCIRIYKFYLSLLNIYEIDLYYI